MFYSNEYKLIHVHGKYQSFEFKAELIIVDGKIIEIKIKSVKGKKTLPSKEFANFVEKFKYEIVQKWIDYFVYHKPINCIKIQGKVK
jgi:hypothetical protein